MLLSLVECWGSGADGFNATGAGGPGGGGGAYANIENYAVTPGVDYSLRVAPGTSGALELSWFGSASTVAAASPGPIGASGIISGGRVEDCVGDLRIRGGSGYVVVGSDPVGGGGGSSASPGSPGVNGSSGTGGVPLTADGGAGGDGGAAGQNGQNGSAPGGGGGGRGAGGSTYGLGASGQVRITYATGYVLTAGRGAFTLAGQDVSLQYGNRLVAAVGTFTIVCNAPGPLRGILLTADRGEFALTGSDAGLLATRELDVAAGAFTFTGIAAALSKTAAYEMVADCGAFALTGQDVTLTAARTIIAARGLFAYSANAADLEFARIAERGVFALVGHVVNLRIGYRLAADRGAFSLTGNDASIYLKRPATVIASASKSTSVAGSSAKVNISSGVSRIG